MTACNEWCRLIEESCVHGEWLSYDIGVGVGLSSWWWWWSYLVCAMTMIINVVIEQWITASGHQLISRSCSVISYQCWLFLYELPNNSSPGGWRVNGETNEQYSKCRPHSTECSVMPGFHHSVAVSLFPLAVHRCRCISLPWLVGVDDWLASYGGRTELTAAFCRLRL